MSRYNVHSNDQGRHEVVPTVCKTRDILDFMHLLAIDSITSSSSSFISTESAYRSHKLCPSARVKWSTEGSRRPRFKRIYPTAWISMSLNSRLCRWETYFAAASYIEKSNRYPISDSLKKSVVTEKDDPITHLFRSTFS